jgi:hypothetical protein
LIAEASKDTPRLVPETLAPTEEQPASKRIQIQIEKKMKSKHAELIQSSWYLCFVDAKIETASRTALSSKGMPHYHNEA